MKTLYASILALIACIGGSGCQATLHADSAVLAGVVPRCKVMLSEARTAYRETAKQECDAVQTPEARKKSAGCAIVHALTHCSS